ncbi:MAG: response regulator [Synergistaceae bacterium]|nr:response regulator [Synergistaceae bacterium]
MKRILVVDDNITNLKQAQALLAGKYDIMLAKSGESALKICAQERPGMILLDVDMPGMDGFETIKNLKQDPALNQIPVIFLTADHSTETEIKALESGAVDFVTKPINKEILLHRLNLHLGLVDYHSSLENSVKELEDNIVISFAELVDCKENNTGTHVLRTGSFVRLLAAELLARGKFTEELTEEILDMMARGAPFHDIGKIGVSDVLLQKPGPLTEEEYAEVKNHTITGSELLKTIYDRAPTQHYLKYASIIAEGHHEHYDGGGYPCGLSGDEIPLCCRIVSIANVYDACLTERVYRKARSHEEACAIIMEGRGTQFDPEIVDVFASIKDKFAELSTELRVEFPDAGKELFDGANIGS